MGSQRVDCRAIFPGELLLKGEEPLEGHPIDVLPAQRGRHESFKRPLLTVLFVPSGRFVSRRFVSRRFVSRRFVSRLPVVCPLVSSPLMSRVHDIAHFLGP